MQYHRTGNSVFVTVKVSLKALAKGLVREPYASRVLGTTNDHYILDRRFIGGVKNKSGNVCTYTFELKGVGVYEVHNGYRQRRFFEVTANGLIVLENLTPAGYSVRMKTGKVFQGA